MILNKEFNVFLVELDEALGGGNPCEPTNQPTNRVVAKSRCSHSC